MTDETPKQWWVAAIEKLGMPTVFLVVIVIACWRVGVYVSTAIIEPLLKTHIEFVKTSTETLEQMQKGGRESLLRIEQTTTETLQILKEK